jgi:hypothetical protein
MTVRNLTLALLLLPAGSGLYCSSANSAKGGKAMIEQQIVELMKKLDALDEQARMKLLSEVDQQRHELLGALLKQLGTSSSKDVRAAAIYLIGRHRLDEGARELVRQIDFEPGPQKWIAAEPLWEKYPAMEALITLGRPSIRPVLELLATESDNLRRDLAVKVIRYAEDAQIARLVLERAAGAERDAERRAKLSDALDRLARLPQ